MKRIIAHTLTLALIAFMSFGLQAQVITNSGATMTIEPGAVLKVEGGIDNSNGGIINNQGIIDVEGDFNNTATYNGTADTVRFSGNADTELTSNSAVFGTMLIEKDATNNVVLMDQATVGAELEFVNDDNKVVIGDNDLILQDGATFDSADDNEFVVTDGTGYVKIQDVANGESHTYPVGGASDRYNPISITANGGNTTDEYGIKANDFVLQGGLVGDTLDESVVDASWELVEGANGGMDINATPSWYLVDETLNFDPDSSAVGLHNGDGWDIEPADFAAAVGGEPNSQIKNGITEAGVLGVGSTGDGVVPATIQGVVVDLKAYLGGALSAGTEMTDNLRAADFIPLMEPYEGFAFGPSVYSHTLYGGLETVDALSDFDPGDAGDRTVDWVLVEVRDASNTTVIASKSALIQRDGNIVDVDGHSSLFIPGIPADDYIVAIKHRNHLPIRTPSTLALSNTVTAYDFTTAETQAYSDPGITGNGPMKQVGSVWAMWNGNAYGDNLISYDGGFHDRLAVLLKVGFATPSNTVASYESEDVNMDALVSYDGGFHDRLSILLTVGFATPSNTVNQHD